MGPTGVAVHFGAISHIKVTPTKFVAIVNKTLDEADGHIARVIEEYTDADNGADLFGGIVMSANPS